MGIRDLFTRKAKSVPQASPAADDGSKEAFMKSFIEKMARKSPSQYYASGAVFDVIRQVRADFEQIVRSNDVMRLKGFFIYSYAFFCTQPEAFGLSSAIIHPDNDDTDPDQWNTDILVRPNGEVAALCFMEIQHETLAARLIGVMLSDEGDRYYYCMLNKGDVPSQVYRNNPLGSVDKVGEVSGLGFELMHSFVDCMSK